jgi:transposase
MNLCPPVAILHRQKSTYTPVRKTATTSLCLFAKRLERGRFVWPQATHGTVQLSAAQLSMLLEGIDWRRVERTYEPHLAA